MCKQKKKGEKYKDVLRPIKSFDNMKEKIKTQGKDGLLQP
jgi:hypothetical protein